MFKKEVYEVEYRDPLDPVSEGAAFKKYLFRVIPEMICEAHNTEIKRIEQEYVSKLEEEATNSPSADAEA